MVLSEERTRKGRQTVSMQLEIPQRGMIELQHAVFDIYGTLAVDGVAVPGVAERLQALSSQLTIHLLTAGIDNRRSELEQTMGFPFHIMYSGDEKMRYVQQLGPANVIAFGNGVGDSSMLRLASIGVAVLTPEGTARHVGQAADVVVYGPINALDLLFHPTRLIATLRG
jgi:soluble P-type ATPase